MNRKNTTMHILHRIILLIMMTSASVAANLAPTLYVQSNIDCLEGGSVDINTVRVDDADANQFLQPKMAVNVTVQHGQIYLPIRSGLFIVRGNMVGPDARYELIGRLGDIQKCLSHIKYLADKDYVGVDLLTIAAFDMHLQTNPLAPEGDMHAPLTLLADHVPVVATTAINLLPINDAPVIATSQRFLTCDEQLAASGGDGTGASGAIDGSGNTVPPSQMHSVELIVALTDPDTQTDEQLLQDIFQLSVSSRYGKLHLASSQCEEQTYSCTIMDTLPALNAAVQRLTYAPDVGYNKFNGNERIGE